MKCRKCGCKAVINLPEHRLGLCAEHYLEWLPEQVGRSIQKYGMFSAEERILVAVSGGKDSLSLWDILLRLGYHADGVYISLGIDEGIRYSSVSHQMAEGFARQRHLTLHVVDVKEQTGMTIPDLAQASSRGRQKPCSVCGLVKRHEMNRLAQELSYNVLATGHNLDDEVAVLLGNTLAWSGEYLLRQGPVLAGSPGLVRKVKPLCRVYEREMLAYALLRGIAYIYDECPFATGATSIAYKDLLNRLENERPGAKLSFYLNFLKARQEGLLAGPVQPEQPLHACTRCGQPTSAPGLCAFCRLIRRGELPGQERVRPAEPGLQV
jgi:uncharacterized protein (TIGR00269 family)